MGNQEGFLCRNGAFCFEFAALPLGTYTFRLAAVQEVYPAVPKRYAVVVGDGFLYAPSHSAYNFGTNDFSIEQEEFNQFIGEIGETRIWSVAKCYKDKEQWQEEELNDSLVGRKAGV